MIEGFQRFIGPGAVVVVADTWADEIEPLELTKPDALERWIARGAHLVPGGRARGWRIALPESGRAVHLRELAHGGVLRGLTGRRFLGLARAEGSLSAAVRLRARGVAVPEPVLFRALRHGPFWHVELGSAFVDGGIGAGRFLETTPSARRARRLARDLGRTVRAFHDAGGSHPDLHVDNLLVSTGPSKVSMVTDLDGVRVGEPPSPDRRLRELSRLYRSLVKRRLGDTSLCAAFLAGYRGADRTLPTQAFRTRLLGVSAGRCDGR